MAETVGSLVDKLCINKLKIYHMNERLAAENNAETKKGYENKLAVLREQGYDLSAELQELMTDLATGKRRLKVYRQFKM